ncbi:MAG TPA: hypothetical protein VMV14_10160 [Acidimicrobiales bacterium]|nr:hypothetical protein [Acidimicrobiales bacterium]
MHGRVEHGVEVGLAPGAKLLHPVIGHSHGGGGYGRDHFLLDQFVDGTEQRLLVTEVMLQGTARDPGQGHDLLTPGSGVTLGREQSASRAE